VREKVIEDLKGELETKRTAKWQKKSLANMKIVLPVTPIDSIPIEIKDKPEYIHYPAGQEDIINLLKMLPQGIADGLSKIILCLGNSHEHERKGFWADKSEPEFDPFVGREGGSVFGEVYLGTVAGRYLLKKSEIRLYGYVYDPELKNRDMWEVYFRLIMLMTFAHEIAHHYDFSHRIARGRWRFDDDDKIEYYAEKIQYEWLGGYIMPYLEKAYPKEIEKLRDWTKKNVGLVCPLEMLAGDPCAVSEDGARWISSFFNTSSAFEEFVDAILKGNDRDEARLEFADDIHMAEGYDMALSIINELLARQPQWAKALILKADIFEHKKEYDKTVSLAKQALELEPDSIRAMEVMADGSSGLEDWKKVIDLSERIIDLCGDDDIYPCTRAIEAKASANLKLGNYDAVKEAICFLMDGPKLAQRMGKRLSEDYEEKLKNAT
jgi:tetratricopeptide (TPR) repeat protein